MREKGQRVIDHFEIPLELATELSGLLVQQTIKERLLTQLIDDDERYEKTEERLRPVVAKIEAIKIKITKEYVPAKYNSRRYMWNYNGLDVDGCKVEVLEDVIDTPVQ